AAVVPAVAGRSEADAMPVEPHVDVRPRPREQLREQVGVVHLAVERALRVLTNGWQHLEEGAVSIVRRIAIAGRVQIAAAQPRLPARRRPLIAASAATLAARCVCSYHEPD